MRHSILLHFLTDFQEISSKVCIKNHNRITELLIQSFYFDITRVICIFKRSVCSYSLILKKNNASFQKNHFQLTCLCGKKNKEFTKSILINISALKLALILLKKIVLKKKDVHLNKNNTLTFELYHYR